MKGAPPRAREAIIEHLRLEGRNSLSLSQDAAWLGKITSNPARLLADMAKKGYAHRIQAGRYLVETGGGGPQDQPLVETLEPLARNLLDKLEVPYYLSWHTALFHYGLIEQQSSTIYCAIPAQKSPAHFGNFTIHFVKVSRDSFFGIEPIVGFEAPVVMANVEKALLDSLSRPDLAAPYPVIVAAFKSAASRGSISGKRLVDYAVQLDGAALARRVGFLMDRYEVQGSEALLDHIGPRRRFEAFRPGDPRDHGEIESKWRLRIPRRLLLTAENLK